VSVDALVVHNQFGIVLVTGTLRNESQRVPPLLQFFTKLGVPALDLRICDLQTSEQIVHVDPPKQCPPHATTADARSPLTAVSSRGTDASVPIRSSRPNT
jgi:hypothetical protein